VQAFVDIFSKRIAQKIPFVFLIDYEQKKPLIYGFEEAAHKGLYFNVKGFTNAPEKRIPTLSNLEKKDLSFEIYKEAFAKVFKGIYRGDSFLVNLTFPTEVFLKNNLLELFYGVNAAYKLYLKDQLVLFSPECFVKIIGNEIAAYPMKGTLDASLPKAKEILTKNQKEQQEHHTIVDLIRNDLSQIATQVRVKKFRYIETLSTSSGKLLQSSSEICGTLIPEWEKNAGKLLMQLLPAGSITGAPKLKTTKLIEQAEQQPRGYYTGVFGVYDGHTLESAVNIRYIEKKGTQYFYRSGGGITHLSNLEEEYEELLKKIYIPAV